MKTKIISIAQIVLLLVFIALLSTFLKPCTGEMVMKCNYSITVVKLLFATVILIKGLEVFGNEKIHNYLDVITILLLISSILIPAWIIGGCKMADMACQEKSFPSVYIGAAALIVWNVILILWRIRKRKDDVKA